MCRWFEGLTVLPLLVSMLEK